MRVEPPAHSTTAQHVEELLERVRPVMAQTVDALQVAALLEADGITDEGARNRFGFEDVFQLACEIRGRCVPPRAFDGRASVAGPHPAGPGSGDRARIRDRSWAPRTVRPPRPVGVQPDATSVRLVSHGLLYLLPVTLFPPALAILGLRHIVLGLVVGGGLAWVWAGASTWVAYQLLSAQKPDAAAHLLRLATISGLAVAAVTGCGISGQSAPGLGVASVAVAQMAYQMGATVLMFHHREGLLVCAMTPAVLGGGLYMLSSTILDDFQALTAGAVSVSAVLALALVVRRTSSDHTATAAWGTVHGDPTQFVLVVLYTALTAVYVLEAQIHYVLGSIDISLGLLPLLVGMGVVELRAHRFRSRAKALMRQVSYPTEFATGIRRVLFQDILVCALTVAGLGVLLQCVLALRGAQSPAGVVMTCASVFLASAYYLSFLMTGMAQLAPLCFAVALALATHVLVAAVVPRSEGSLVDTSIFATSAALLLAVSLAAILPSITDPRAH